MAAPEAVIPLNHKFSALAFDDCIAVELAKPVELAPNLRAYPAAPFELPKHWKAWLGTLKSGHFSEANLVIVITRVSATPGVLDQETRDLERILTAFVFGLMLDGGPDYKETTWFSGANVEADLSVRGLRSLETFIRTPGQLGGQELDAIALAWTDAAQRLATDVYRRLISSPALLTEFRNEASTQALWKLDDAERRCPR